jgi:hypothetical protein
VITKVINNSTRIVWVTKHRNIFYDKNKQLAQQLRPLEFCLFDCDPNDLFIFRNSGKCITEIYEYNVPYKELHILEDYFLPRGKN